MPKLLPPFRTEKKSITIGGQTLVGKERRSEPKTQTQGAVRLYLRKINIARDSNVRTTHHAQTPTLTTRPSGKYFPGISI